MSYSIKMPDMSRNVALAGKTVSSRGMNITYDENGYAVEAVNYEHKIFALTDRSIAAPSKDAVLAAAPRASYGGSAADQAHFSDQELAYAADLRQQVADGVLPQASADYFLEEVRRRYGYSGGTSGNEYIALDLPAYPRAAEPKTTVAAAAAAEPTVAATAGEPPLAAEAVSAASVQSAAAPQAKESAETRLQDAYQEELRLQQQQQTLRTELKEMRTMDRLLRFTEREQVPGALLDMMDREDEDEEKKL